MPFQLEREARFLGGETRIARFVVAAFGEKRAFVHQTAPFEREIRDVLHLSREVEGRGERVVRADGIGVDVRIFKFDHREGVGIVGVVGGILFALLHDGDAHRVGGRKHLVGVAQY